MLAAVLLLAAIAPGPRPDDGEALLRRINAAHKATWFTTLTFVQRSSWPDGSQPDETWYESMDRPGKLRLDREKDGKIFQSLIFRNDSLYPIVDGQARPGRPLVHALLVLLHDIHVGDIDAAVAKLRQSGFDLSKTHDATWEGKAVTVVGAVAGDSTSNQFWVDNGRLVVVRVIQVGQGGQRSDIHVGGFTDTGHGFVESDIRMHSNGKFAMHEEYTAIKTGMALPPSIFDPASTELPAWVVSARGN